MYGLINLTFDNTVPSADDNRVWAQGGDWDWYAYYNSGSEVVTLTFCSKEGCEPGEWFVEVYDFAGANQVAGGGSAVPLLAFNTDITAEDDDGNPLTYRFGLPNAETYYMRVNHKRLFSAPCRSYGLDTDNNGIVDGGACACDSGDSCAANTVLTAASCLAGTSTTSEGGDTTTTQAAATFCPDGSDGTQVSGTSSNAYGTNTQVQCETTCRCVAWGGVVELPENEVSSQYNFTWNATDSRPTPM